VDIVRVSEESRQTSEALASDGCHSGLLK